MLGKKTNWVRARNAAERIQDADYTLKNFYDDVTAAFPELRMYYLDSTDGMATTTSGRSQDDEYQRTMGALFAFFWLMRLDLDGPQSFCHGVGKKWEPLTTKSSFPIREDEEKNKREIFLSTGQWNLFGEVLVHAGIKEGTGNHNRERTLAMLALTAIHDIMKNQDLLPTNTTQEEFRGYKPGETINDHDVALAFVLEYLPSALPSFDGLPADQKASVKFTQSKMEYNMGWLVQAEAPPGALFRKFRGVIHAGHASALDVAFYFVHWLTDLAGAEPFPLEGCEKFVLKFPQPVLKSFLDSFPVVRQLDCKSETQVFEDYLVWRWQRHTTDLGPVPSGRGCIARMRLGVMAQLHTESVVKGYDHLRDDDKHVLNVELAKTAITDQVYTRDQSNGWGPAFLVYYAPAFLQKNGGHDPVFSLEVLAELLRQARGLWPETSNQGNDTVTLRIDILKELDLQTLSKLAPGEFWAIQKSTSVDGHVRKASVTDADWANLKVLNLLPKAVNDGTKSAAVPTKAATLPPIRQSFQSMDCRAIISQSSSWMPCCIPRLGFAQTRSADHIEVNP